MIPNYHRIARMDYRCHIGAESGRNGESMESVAGCLSGSLRNLATSRRAFIRRWYPPNAGQGKCEHIWVKTFRVGELLRMLESGIDYTLVWCGLA
jgi:hypothetical protein